MRPPPWGWRRRLGQPRAQPWEGPRADPRPLAGHRGQTRRRKRLHGWWPWSLPQQNPSPHAGSAANPPFARLGLGGHREALVALTVRAAAADIRDLQLRVAVLLPAQSSLWTPNPWQCQAGSCCQARRALGAQALPRGSQERCGCGASPCPCRGQVAQGAGQRVGVEVWGIERRRQLGKGASEVGVKVPGILGESTAVRTQQARGLGVAGGTWRAQGARQAGPLLHCWGCLPGP